MKLKTIILRNFRCYREETRIPIAGLTALIGKNDAGKSSILEALEIFFNNNTVKLEQGDVSVGVDDGQTVLIGCVFTDLPSRLILDESAETTLANEHLLNADGDLEIHKAWDFSSSKTPKERVSAYCCHPTVEVARDLLQMSNAQLKAQFEKRGLDAAKVDLRVNHQLREAIWQSFDDLGLSPTLVALDKEDAKKVWEQLKKELPTFALFRADRPNRDDDDEVQDPMKVAVTQAVQAVEEQLDTIKKRVQEEARGVALATIAKLREMDETLATALSPVFRDEPKWSSIFKLTIEGENGIPLNKRGSGVRRLVLLSFFRVQAERASQDARSHGIIYAIEEPEASQHPTNQRMLLQALMEISEKEECQVILTTHVPGFAGWLPIEALRYVVVDKDGKRRVLEGNDEVYDAVARDLGVVPDNRVRVLVCVEGPHDVEFLSHASAIMHATCPSVPALGTDPRVAFLPMGGGTLKQWVENRYLREFGRPEVHIYDRDRGKCPAYKEACDRVNQERPDGSKAFITEKAEMENYLHPDAIWEARGVHVGVTDDSNVPMDVAKAIYEAAGNTAEQWDSLPHDEQKKKATRAKRALNTSAVQLMTPARFSERDPDGEILTWLHKISELCGG